MLSPFKKKLLYWLWLWDVKVALKQNSLSPSVKKDIYKSFVRCKHLIDRHSKEPVSCTIGPYTFKVPNAELLQILLREIMINEQYYIPLDTPNPFIIDCGSNLGFSILYFKLKYPQATIVGVEAGAETFEWLQNNVRQLKGVTLHNKFVADRDDETKDFYTYGPGDVSASFDQSRGSIHAHVPTVSLERLIGDRTVDLLKIDIEGGEFSLFHSGAKVDYLKQVKNILMEYHQNIDHKVSNSLGEFLSVFDKNNFAYNIEADKKRKETPYFQDLFLKMKKL